jgi:hypothetical protein
MLSLNRFDGILSPGLDEFIDLLRKCNSSSDGALKRALLQQERVLAMVFDRSLTIAGPSLSLRRAG